MSRAQWKGSFLDSYLLKKKAHHTIWSRRSTITARFLGKRIRVHNGKKFIKLFITRNHLGFKFGQFIFTKKYTQKFKPKAQKSKVKKVQKK